MKFEMTSLTSTLSTVLMAFSLMVPMAVGGCGGSTHGELTAPTPRTLSEPQALLVVRRVMTELQTPTAADSKVKLRPREELRLDLRLGGTGGAYGVEWVTELDREAHPESLPSVDRRGPLRIVTVRDGTNSEVQVLVLDERNYGYEGNPTLVQRGAIGISEAEERLRQDVLDFSEYMRTQAARR